LAAPGCSASGASFFRLCPSTSTHAKVGHRLQICHPDRSGPGFPTSRYRPRQRMRLSVKAARSSPTPLNWTEIRGSGGEGPAVSLGPHANADKRSVVPWFEAESSAARLSPSSLEFLHFSRPKPAPYSSGWHWRLVEKTAGPSPTLPRISCRTWSRLRTSCGFPY
jgi:hypothetical protein